MRPWDMADARPGQRGFTLIELMITVAILGVLAAVAINAYTKNIRRARRTEVISDLSKMSVLQETAFRVRSHYVTTLESGINSFGAFYPAPQAFIASPGVRKAERVQWRATDPGYHQDSKPDAGFFLGGGGIEHGFDALGFMPEGGGSRCSYATSSGLGQFTPPGSNQPVLDAPHGTMLNTVFNDDRRFTSRHWFVNMAACDLDADGRYWFFYTNSYDSRVYDGVSLPAANAFPDAY